MPALAARLLCLSCLSFRSSLAFFFAFSSDALSLALDGSITSSIHSSSLLFWHLTLSPPYPETDCCIYRRCMPRAFHDWSELSFSVQCRSVSAETIRLIRDHLDFHTAPELCCLSLKALSFVLKSTCPSLPSLSRAWILGPL